MNYIPNNKTHIKEMCNDLGISKPDDLFTDIPDTVKLKNKLNIPNPLSEQELTNHIKKITKLNTYNNYETFLGAGIYDHYIPSVVKHLSNRSEFLTSYTPYQAEMSQGILQSIFEYQTYIARITGLEVSNASLYDGATALYEAINMSILSTRRKKVILSPLIHPEYLTVVKTYLAKMDTQIEYLNTKNNLTDIDDIKNKIDEHTACVVIPQINFLGQIEDIAKAREFINNGTLLINTFYATSLGILKSPGELGADIAVGEGQCLGLPMYLGGLTLGLIATKKSLLRLIPGRIVGQTTDSNDNKGFVLTLQAREQHIRRSRAQSNICSNQAWCALVASIYLSTTGEKGFKNLALTNLEKAHYFANKLDKIDGLKLENKNTFFNEFVLTLDKKYNIDEIDKKLREQNIILGLKLKNYYATLKNSWLVCVTEKKQINTINNTVEIITNVCRNGSVARL